MPAFDQCHDQVVRALQKDGWQIGEEQYLVATDDRYVFVDLRMVRQVNGTTEQIMLLEAKCFPENSPFTKELYQAIGQYMMYYSMLVEAEISAPLYLSIPLSVYQSEFDSVVRHCIRHNQIKLVIVNLETEQIVTWIR